MLVGMLLALIVSFAFQIFFAKKVGKPNPAQPGLQKVERLHSIEEAMNTKGLASAEAAKKEVERLKQEFDRYDKTRATPPDLLNYAGWCKFRVAYIQETVLKDPKSAAHSYQVFSRKYSRTPYGPTAAYRHACLVWDKSENKGHREGKKEFERVERTFLVDQTSAKQQPFLSLLWFANILKTPSQSLIHFPDRKPEPIMEAVCRRIEPLNRKDPLYQVLDHFVTLFGRNKHYSYAFAIILFGVLVKLLLQPLNKASFKSMREMQKVQPEMKKIQEKYKGDKANPQKMNQEVMALYKAHGVNPMGGCLPMLIQMPVLILLYRAIMSYRCQFYHADFLWIDNLAMPDMPLLILYGVSMIFSTKLTTMPTADPAQQQQQKMMSWMMPIMFVMICRTFPAAFVLYWMTFNVMQTAQQLMMYRKWDREEGKENLGGLAGRIKSLQPPTPPADSNGKTNAEPQLDGKTNSGSQRRRRRKKK